MSNPETKWHSEDWKHLSFHSRIRKEDHTLYLFYIYGILHHEYVSTGQTVNTKFYVEILKHLSECMQHSQPKLWVKYIWTLH